MRLVQLFLSAITVTNIIFLILNIQYLVFLKKRAVTPAEAEELFIAHGRRNVVVEGTFLGFIEKKGSSVVTDRRNTLNNDLTINLGHKLTCVLTDLNNITYGEMVRVEGVIDFVGNDFVLYDVKVISVLRKDIVTKYLNKRYSRASIYSIFITLILEVVRVCIFTT